MKRDAICEGKVGKNHEFFSNRREIGENLFNERGSHETNAKRTILKVMRNFEKFVGDLSTANVALS